MNWRDKFTNFMYGRYGVDQLSRFMLVVIFILCVLSLFIKGSFMSLLILVLIILTYYRKPLRFNTTTGASKCELPESVHSEIVDLAVNMFITEGKYRLQTKPSNQSNRE